VKSARSGASRPTVAARGDQGAEAGPEVAPDRHDPGPRSWFAAAERRRRAVLLAILLLLAVPMIVALVALRHPRWYPLLDLAWTEMRLRDVWSAHPPLLGLAGRIGPFGHQGSHPGPVSFYALWPFYQLFGASSWAMEAASVALHVVAIGVMLWIANRRGGLRLVLGLVAVLAVLLRAFGAVLLTQAWNPYLPVLWWLVFLLAVWAVLCDDFVLLPVAAFAGSFCAQTEVAYLGLCVGLGLIAVAFAGVRTYQRRRDRDQVRRFAMWALIAAAVAAAIWLPPVVEQLTTSRGNLSVLFDYFRHPPQSPAGFGQGIKVLLAHLNPVTPFANALVPTASHIDVTTGSVIPGSLFLTLWAVTAFTAWRWRLRPLLELHVVLALTMLLGAFSISRIFGSLWYYLVLWAWGLNVLMLVAVGWTLGVVVGRRLQGATRQRADTAGRLVLVGVAVAMTVLFAVEAAGAEFPTPRLSRTLGAVVNPTVRALERRPGPDGGRRGKYLVTFGDPASLGAQGFGLMNELERRGFDIGAFEMYRGPVTPHRVLNFSQASAIVHLSIGPDIPYWRAKPGVQEVAYYDPRSRKERAEFDRIHAEVIADLRAHGLEVLVPGVDGDLFATTLDPRLPRAARIGLSRLADLGLPAAVFLAPPSVKG
jgi:hypothetical protein